jgi:branched-chain amino acid transport system ATP-binding protein
MGFLRLRRMECGTWRRPVSLEVDERECILLLGRNGAGKSTLLNTVAGLLPVFNGCVEIDNVDTTTLDEEGRIKYGVRIALEGRQPFRRLSVRRNLLLGTYVRRPGGDPDHDFEWVLNLFPILRQKLEQSAGSLSGGQQTMVNIGRALMGNPRLLLLDEPALGLDPKNVGKLIEALWQIREERGVSALIAEQSGHFARAFRRRVVLLVGGEILFDGPWEEAEEAGKLSTVLV